MDMWVIETCGDISKICATREIALIEFLRMLKESYKEEPDNEQELKDYRELMEEYFSPYKENFGIDGFFWVFKAEFIDE